MNKVSAMVVAYNEDDWVKESITSILPYVNEVIFVDDSSTDKTLELVKSINSPKIKIFTYEYHKLNHLRDLKNFAISKSTNEWLLRWDADFIAYEAIGKILKFAVNHSFDSFLLTGPNMGGDINHQRADYPEFGPELYLFKKGVIEFVTTERYGDYPTVIGSNKICYRFEKVYGWLHLSNLKSIDKLAYRTNMSPWLASGTDLGYYEWINKEKHKSEYSLDKTKEVMHEAITNKPLQIKPFDFNKYGKHPTILTSSASANKFKIKEINEKYYIVN